MSNHTPGPWRFEKDAGQLPCRFINADTFDEIALLRGTPDWEVQDANAKLIAAAPDLLEACKVAREACRANLTYYQFKDERTLLKALGVCQEAIKKATE